MAQVGAGVGGLGTAPYLQLQDRHEHLGPKGSPDYSSESETKLEVGPRKHHPDRLGSNPKARIACFQWGGGGEPFRAGRLHAGSELADAPGLPCCGSPTESLALPWKEEARPSPCRPLEPLLEGQEWSRWPGHTWCRGSPWPSRAPRSPDTGGPPAQGHPGSLQQEVRGRPEPHPQRVAAQRQPVPRQSLPGPLVLRRGCRCPGRAVPGGVEQRTVVTGAVSACSPGPGPHLGPQNQ